jgi:hypothetical protein
MSLYIYISNADKHTPQLSLKSRKTWSNIYIYIEIIKYD